MSNNIYLIFMREVSRNMCRLAGYYIPKRTRANSLEAKFNLIDLVVAQQTGGFDSTGIGLITKDKKFIVLKEAIPANQFMTSKEVAKLMDTNNPRSMIAHCRMQTQGDKTNNQNNHPHFTKSGLVTIHNGAITNDAELFIKYSIPRDAQVDSEIIPKLIEYYLPECKDTTEAIRRAIKEIRGSIATAILNASEPDALYLVRREGNLSLALDKDSGVIYFATEREALAEILYKRELCMGFFMKATNVGKILIQEIPLGMGVKITKQGIDLFEVETPPFQQWRGNGQNHSRGLWCPIDKCLWTDGSKCKHNYQEIKAMTQDTPNQLKIDEWALGIRKGFVVKQSITKPSKFTNGELEARLEYLETKEFKRPLEAKLNTEARRIEQTLTARLKVMGAIEDNKPSQPKLLN